LEYCIPRRKENAIPFGISRRSTHRQLEQKEEIKQYKKKKYINLHDSLVLTFPGNGSMKRLYLANLM
jgi:hypothetical protein